MKIQVVIMLMCLAFLIVAALFFSYGVYGKPNLFIVDWKNIFESFNISRNLVASVMPSEIIESKPSEVQLVVEAMPAVLVPDVVIDDEPAVENPVMIEIIFKQEKIDELLDRIDLLKRQLADLVEAERVFDVVLPLDDDAREMADQIDQIDGQDRQETVVAAISFANIGSGQPVYPGIVISEVQIAAVSDETQEFVELYNPNAVDVDLSGWYVQRKTKSASNFSTYAPSTLFSGKKIVGRGYFLMVRQGSALAFDVAVDHPLTDDNTLALKNPNGDIADKVGWGEAQDHESAPAQNPPPGQSIGRKADESDTQNNTNDFAINILTPRASNVAYVAPIPEDIVAPQVVFDPLSEVQATLSFSIGFTITDTAENIAPSGIAGYTFRHKENEGDWQEDDYRGIDGASLIFSGTKEFTGSDEKSYYFQIKTKDVAGNESDWQPENPIITTISLFKKIVISEIKTAGETARDEFIELYNPYAVDANLAGFSLKKKTASGTESNLVSSGSFAGIIKAGGFFLIAPQDNDDGTKNYTGFVAPDARYSGETFSIASHNTVLLYDANEVLVDKVGFGGAGDFETMPAENPTAERSIGRVKNADGTIKEDADNNALDFALQDPDPQSTDNMAPVISNVGAQDIKQDTVRIIWETDELSTSKVEYGQGADYGLQSLLDTTLVTSHAITLPELLPDTQYHYRVKSKDVAENEVVSDDQTFTTLADTLPPVRSNGLPGGQLPSDTLQVDINLVTDEAATCKYSTIPNQTYATLTDVFLTTDDVFHMAIIQGLADGNSYTYYAICADATGNANTDDFVITFDVAFPEPPPPQVMVAINEIAWMGSSNSANDEWIELFNPGEVPVDLLGWKLESVDGTPTIVLSGQISAHGFYLLERTDDTTVPEVMADQLYTGALGNGGEHFYLRNSLNEIVDQIDCAAGWFAGDNDTKQTMQRKDPLFSGTVVDNWQTSQEVGGSPKS